MTEPYLSYSRGVYTAAARLKVAIAKRLGEAVEPYMAEKERKEREDADKILQIRHLIDHPGYPGYVKISDLEEILNDTP